MNKVQRLDFVLPMTSKRQHAIYNPFTGELLQLPDPFEQMDEQFTDSVTLSYVTEFFEDGPFYSHPDYDFDIFRDLEGQEALEEVLENLDDDKQYFILTIQNYGNIPGDYGAIIYVLKTKR